MPGAASGGGWNRAVTWTLCLCALAATHAPAQEALRYSLAGQAAAEARRVQLDNLDSTWHSGDFHLTVTPMLGLDWNSNVNTSQDNPEDDFILRPTLRLGMLYPVTQHNLLNLTVGLGYDHYLNQQDLSRWRVDAGSQVSFDMFIEDFWINFHNRFSYVRDSASDSSVAGGDTADFGNFENTLGVLVNWDANDLTASLGYDHLNVISTSDRYAYQDRRAELFLARAGMRVHPTVTAGVEGTINYSVYDEPILNDNTGYSLGAYADWQPGRYLRVQPRLGYSIYDFRQTGTFPAQDTDAWYVDLTIRHDASKAVSYSLSAGRQLYPGTQGDITDKLYVRPSATWRVVRDWTFTTSLGYERGKQTVFSTVGSDPEVYDWLSAGFGVNREIIRKLSGSLNYRFSYRLSNVSSREYAQHVVGLLFTYRL